VTSDATDPGSTPLAAGAPAETPPNAFLRWAQVAEAVRATSKRLEKGAALDRYLATLDDDALAIAARFFSGYVFPRHDMRTTRVGGSIVWGALASVVGVTEEELIERYQAHGDTGDLVGDLLESRRPCLMTIQEMEAWFAELAAATGTTARRRLVHAMLARLGGLEARYAVKLLGGELRIGLKEAQVEEALARAFGRPLAQVRRAALLRGDVGEVAQLARRGALESARLALFHPIGFMLATPLATPEEIAAALPTPFVVEDKYDGIRAQAHVGGGRVALYSRTLDEITQGYPDVVEALGALARASAPSALRRQPSAAGEQAEGRAPRAEGGFILDGELLAVDPAHAEGPPAERRALPFKALQRRLGRKKPDAALLAEVPAAFVAYDVVAAEGALVVDEPYDVRRRRLEALPWPATGAWLAPNRLVTSPGEVERAFADARARGNEGLIAKDPSSPYTPGRRGKSWVKLKRAMATLDVVVTGVERGHGKRKGVLSDYTFAVRASEDDGTLLNVGKAYTGLTDVEIAELTERFKAITTARYGGFHAVRPEIVLEVTFDVVQPSARHKAGYALRFPRIVRVRDDKRPEEIDTLARVRELAEGGGA
jgi:DNA ligase 1